MVPPLLRPGGSTIALCLAGALAACTPPIRPPEPLPNVAAAPLQGRTGACLTVRDAASRVQVVMAALPGLLFRISTPPGSGLTPRVVSRDGRAEATLRPTGGDGPDEVRIVLNRDVRWAIRLPAGAGEQQLDLRRGRVARVEVGASGLVELRLPAPVGTVPVSLTEDVGTVVLTTPPATPVRIQRNESTRQTRTWSNSRDRYAVRVHGSIGSLILRSATEPLSSRTMPPKRPSTAVSAVEGIKCVSPSSSG